MSYVLDTTVTTGGITLRAVSQIARHTRDFPGGLLVTRQKKPVAIFICGDGKPRALNLLGQQLPARLLKKICDQLPELAADFAKKDPQP